MSLEEKLIQLRKKKGMSQAHVAEMLDVTRQAISRWEVGAALPSTENLRKLAELYGVSVDMLLNETVDVQEPTKVDQTAEEALHHQEKITVCTTCTLNVKKVRYIVLSVVLAFLVFLAGYIIGQEQVKKMQNSLIPLSELETMHLDLSEAEQSTFGWIDSEKGGE